MAPKPPAASKAPIKKVDKNAKVQKKTGKKGKSQKNKEKNYKTKLSGWLKTPADWARFNAWAKKNAQPRKIPEPPEVERISKPLWKMKKRIEVLSKPSRKIDPNENFNFDWSVSKKALKAKPSKRIKILAKFVPKYEDPGREFPIQVTKAALNYKASSNIAIIARPKDFRSEECKEMQEKWQVMKNNIDNGSKRKKLILAKQALKCPGLLTDSDIQILITDTGVYRSALTYKPSPWMNFLALPSYKFLKDRKDEKSKKLKDEYLKDLRTRGKKALIEKTKKIEAEKSRIEAERLKKIENDRQQNEDENLQNVDEGGEENEGEKIQEEETPENEEKKDEKAVEEIEELDDEESKKKWMKRNAWRFAPPPWKDYDPLIIKKSALEAPVSPRMADLAKPSRPRKPVIRPPPRDKDPFGRPIYPKPKYGRKMRAFKLKKSGQTEPSQERIDELAKPSRPRKPVTRPPPREKDSLGRPIYPKPKYGKKMPRVEPYKERECNENQSAGNQSSKMTGKEEEDKTMIDPIAFEPTIDPFFDPNGAKRQLKARKMARDILKKEKKPDNAGKSKIDDEIGGQLEVEEA